MDPQFQNTIDICVAIDVGNSDNGKPKFMNGGKTGKTDNSKNGKMRKSGINAIPTGMAESGLKFRIILPKSEWLESMHMRRFAV